MLTYICVVVYSVVVAKIIYRLEPRARAKEPEPRAKVICISVYMVLFLALFYAKKGERRDDKGK